MFYSTKGAGLPFKAATALPATVESIWRDCFPAKGRKSGSWGKQRWREGRKKDRLVPKECVNVTSTWFPPKVKEQLPGYLLLTYICFVKFQQNTMTTMRKRKWRRESCCKLDMSYFSGWRQQPCISHKETRLWRAPSYIHFSPPPHPPSSLHRASPRRGSSYIHDSGCVSALLPLRPCLHLMSSTIPPFSIGGSRRVFGREEDEKTWFIHQFQDVGHRSRVTPHPAQPPRTIWTVDIACPRPVQVQDQSLLCGHLSSSSVPIVTCRDGGKEASIQLEKRARGAPYCRVRPDTTATGAAGWNVDRTGLSEQ